MFLPDAAPTSPMSHCSPPLMRCGSVREWCSSADTNTPHCGAPLTECVRGPVEAWQMYLADGASIRPQSRHTDRGGCVLLTTITNDGSKKGGKPHPPQLSFGFCGPMRGCQRAAVRGTRPAEWQQAPGTYISRWKSPSDTSTGQIPQSPAALWTFLSDICSAGGVCNYQSILCIAY